MNIEPCSRTLHHILRHTARYMENIDIIYALLGTLVVALSAILASKRLSRSHKATQDDPWSGIGKATQSSDYFYTED